MTHDHDIFASVQLRAPFTSEEVAHAVDATIRTLVAQLHYSAVMEIPLTVVPDRGAGWLVWGRASEPNEGAPIDCIAQSTDPAHIAALHNGEQLLPEFYRWLEAKVAESVTPFGFE